jgi:hypothetical protein
MYFFVLFSLSNPDSGPVVQAIMQKTDLKVLGIENRFLDERLIRGFWNAVWQAPYFPLSKLHLFS